MFTCTLVPLETTASNSAQPTPEMNPSTQNPKQTGLMVRDSTKAAKMYVCPHLKLRWRKHGGDAAAAEMQEFYSVVINCEVPSFHSAIVTLVTEECQAEMSAGLVSAGTCTDFSPPRPQLGMLRLRGCCRARSSAGSRCRAAHTS